MYYNANISTKFNYLKTPKVGAWVGEISTQSCGLELGSNCSEDIP